jgi:beta-N-acetylhexosaminidase
MGHATRARFPAVLAVAALGLVAPSACSAAPGNGASPVASSSPGPTASGPALPASATTPVVTSSAASSAPAHTSPPATATAGTSCVDRTLAGLSSSARAGQLLLVGVPATDPASQAPPLAALHVAGIFLHGRVAGGSTLRSGIATAQSAARHAGALPLLVAADEEGGLVQTVRGGTLPPFPAALAQGGWTSTTLARSTRTWGSELARLGVDLDLAPVADVVPASLGRANPPIGAYDRQYGSTPAAVSRSVVVVTSALRRVGVGPVVKHFPGLGRVRANTDTSAAAVDAVTTASDPALHPFADAVRAGALAVMVSSARYPRLDAERPAMWSPAVIEGLLRGRLGWHGLVVSDDLGIAVAAKALPVGSRATSFVAAGGDLVLTVEPGQARTMRDALLARARADRAFAARIDDAVRHVLAVKAALGLLTCG